MLDSCTHIATVGVKGLMNGSQTMNPPRQSDILTRLGVNNASAMAGQKANSMLLRQDSGKNVR